MTQISRIWDGTTVGDAVQAPYDAATEMANFYKSLSGAGGNANYRGGVFMHELNSLDVRPGAGNVSPVSINTGRALVAGTWYENDAVELVTIPTPVSATRIDLIVLRKDWSTREVRLSLMTGAEGAGVPPVLTQTQGITWEMTLAQVTVTTAGVVTVSDRRSFIGVAGHKPLAIIANSANQSVPHNANTQMNFNTLLYESTEDSGMWDAGSPGGIIIPFRGIYRVTGKISWDLSSPNPGVVTTRISRNSVATILDESGKYNSGAGIVVEVTWVGELQRDDVIGLVGYQFTTVSVLSLGRVNPYFPRLMVEWIRSYY